MIAAFRDSSRRPRSLASVRAGNVIGGGDDTPGRLLPDLIRAAHRRRADRGPRAATRSAPGSTCSTRSRATCCWPSGSPRTRRSRPLELRARGGRPAPGRVDRRARQLGWPGGLDVRYAEHPPRHEAAIPRVDSTRARTRLGWRPPWDLAAAIDMTVEWHLADRDVSLEQIERHGAMTPAAP